MFVLRSLDPAEGAEPTQDDLMQAVAGAPSAEPAAPAESEPIVAAEPPAPDPLAELRKELQATKDELAQLRQPAPSKEPPPLPPKAFEVGEDIADLVMAGGKEGAMALNRVIQELKKELSESYRSELQGSITPLQRSYIEAERTRAKAMFVEKYPDLKDLVDIAEEIAPQIYQGRQGQFRDNDEFFEAVAKATREKAEKYKKLFGVAPTSSAPAGGVPADKAKARSAKGVGLTEDEKEMEAVATGY